MKKFPLICCILLFNGIGFAQDTVFMYLDHEFQTTKKTFAKYIRTVIMDNDHYYVTDKNMKDEIINYGEYKSVNPWIEDGWARHYSKPGILYSEGKYVNGKITGKWIYYSEKNIDTVNYSLNTAYFNQKDCPKAKKIFIDKENRQLSERLTDSIRMFMSDNFFLPARTEAITNTYFQLGIRLILDIDGKIKCPEIITLVHDDLHLEIMRILALYATYEVPDYPLELEIEFIYDDRQKRTTPSHSGEELFFIVEQMPRFQYSDCPESDINCFRNYLTDSLRIPSYDCEGHIFVQFVVNKEGMIEDVKIVRGIDGCPGYEDEIKRLFYSSPRWIPGKQRGVPVRVQFTFPILFKPK